MAGREKKPALLKKQMISPVPPKEGEAPVDTSANKTNTEKSDPPTLESEIKTEEAPAKTAAVKPVANKKPRPKKPVKKNLNINFKTKNKKAKKVKLSKSIFKGGKLNLDNKNVTLVKNGIKNKKKPQKKKIPSTNNTIASEEGDLLPPVLEPMTALSEGPVVVKKEPKKRTKKGAAEDAVESLAAGTSDKKQKLDEEKLETVEDILKDVAHELDLDMDLLIKKPAKKGKVTKKACKPGDAKPKRAAPKKPRSKKEIKSQTLMDTLCKDITLDSAAQNIINKLDLNVNKATKKPVVRKRRHSIEKIPTVEANPNDSQFEQPFVLFSTSRRSASPRSKRNSKVRQSIESAVPKRFSPYTTRSDSPARILRNGKLRKLKDSQLLDGLDCEYKKRRRLCSEYSGSEISKCSGYLSESDSSFSDLASVQENGSAEMDSPPKEGNLTKSDLLKKEILESIKSQQSSPSPDTGELQNLNIKSISTKFAAILKRSLSTETSQISESILNEDVKPKSNEVNVNSFTDTNSNDVKIPEIKSETNTTPTATQSIERDDKTDIKNISVSLEFIKTEATDEQIAEKIASSPSQKVPEKSIILDQMKQTFNDSNEEYEKRTTRSSRRNLKLGEETMTVGKFYGSEITSENTAETKPIQTIAETVPESVAIEISTEVLVDTSIPEQPENSTEAKEAEKEEERKENAEAEETTQKKNSEVIPEQPLCEPSAEQTEMKMPENEPVETVNTVNNEERKTPELENDLIEPLEENLTPEIIGEVSEQEKDESKKETIIQQEPEVERRIDLEEELLTKLKENSAISIVFRETRKEKKEVVSEVNGTVDSLKSHDTLETKGERLETSPEITIETSLENKMDTSQENIVAEPSAPAIEETPENLAIKENILSALGLQSLRAAEEAKLRDKQKLPVKNDEYTGTLKTVIKLNRSGDKKKRNPLKMTLQKSKSRNLKDGETQKTDGANEKSDGENSCYKVMKESGSSSAWRLGGSQSSDTAGANRKSHYSNRSNMDGSSEHASDGDAPATDGEASVAKALVIPEKASSFSIHPDRLCSDECAYCFGKFGLFDTPLHIAQIKSVDRQNKILENEIYLMRDSCLCDACYRHVDRRSNTSSYGNKSYKRNNTLSTIPRPNHCHVLGCHTESSHVLRRKWLIKMRKSVARVINLDLANPGLHSIPVCSDHYAAVEHLMVCALCKRRLARNHIHYLGFEWNVLNTALEKEGIPVKLSDKPVVCKLCRYFSTLLLKPPGEIKSNTASFFKEYKKRLLHFHDVEVMDDAEAEEPIPVPLKEKPDKEMLKKRKNKPSRSSKNANSELNSRVPEEPGPESEKNDQSRVPFNSENGESGESSPSESMVDIETLVPNMVLECASDTEANKSEVPHKAIYTKLQRPESVREAVEISKILKVTKKNNVVERLGSNPSISVRQLFPGEEDLPLQGQIDFNSVKERTPEGWEKCSCTIQYDVDTKHLWQELQKPYGNQSSFLRHLILLEKYFRNGDLTLAPNASHHAVNYSVSVQNRLRAYDNIPTTSLPMQPLTMLPFNQVKKSQSGIITTIKDPVANLASVVNAANLPKNTPIPISQLNPNFLTQLSVRQKAPGIPPGLISLQTGTNRPVAPSLIKVPQKIKLPIGKNWRPTLIPVTATASIKTANSPPGAVSPEKRLTGLVQVISGGKPYHISLQDYNRVCNMKKAQDMKQKTVDGKLKRDTESKNSTNGNANASASTSMTSSNSVLKPVISRKPKSLTATVTKSTPIASSTPKHANYSETSRVSTDRIPDSVEIKGNTVKSLMILPKIPKSLTVIPQTVPRKPPQPSSPTLSITTKPSTSKS